MGLDQYIYRIKLIECPHCKERLPIVDINRYNNDEDYHYYGISSETDDLKDILKHNGSLYDDNAQKIKAAIIDTENGEAVYCYCADW